MIKVYQSDAFAERVNFAANYISQGRATTRAFDTCFEMHDGDAVATALVRRARANPNGKLAHNLFNYIGQPLAEQCADKLANIPTCQLKHTAADMRDKASML